MITINDKKDCMGCHACLNICPQNCIAMKSDNEGFWYPKVECKKCIKCGLCIKVCPIINKTLVKNEPRAYACINKDEYSRLKSSSGGMFTLIAEQVIDKGGIVFGAAFDGNFNLIHSYTDNIEELSKYRGSKYLQSKIGDTYKQAKEFLVKNHKVLFSGTPCQIAGLKSYLGTEYDNLICIDIVCHGVPSPKVFNKYLIYQENRIGSPIQRIAFRLKNEGWKRYSVSFLFDNNTEYQQTFDKDLYMKAFLRDVCLRTSCYACKFKTLHRQSDLTLADFWGIKNILPELDDDRGTSLVFVNSANGQSVLEEIKDEILYKEVDINQAIVYNSAAIKCAGYNSNRKNFFDELDHISFDKLIAKYCSDGMFVRIKRKGKLLIYTILKNIGVLNAVKGFLERK